MGEKLKLIFDLSKGKYIKEKEYGKTKINFQNF